MNNTETPSSDGSNETRKGWQETLESLHEQIENETDVADSEIGRIKMFIGELVVIHQKHLLRPAAQEIDGSGQYIVFIERVIKTDIATTILADFQEGWDFNAHIGSKRKRLQVFYDKIVAELNKQVEENTTPDTTTPNVETSHGASLEEKVVEEKREALPEFEAIEDYHAEMKKRKEEGDAEGAVSIAKRGILKFPESGLLWMELANMLTINLKNYNEAFIAWLNAIIYNSKFVNDYLFTNLHKTSSYSEEEIEDAILKIADEMRMLGKIDESDILLKRAIEVYEEHADKFSADIVSDSCDEESPTDEPMEDIKEISKQLAEAKAELEEELERIKKELEESDNNVDRARQTAFSSAPPSPNSPDGKLVTSNQELQKKVKELENQIAENEIENANFPHQIELLESEVKRLEEYIDEINKLPAPEVNAISESIKEKEALETKVAELEKKVEEQKKAVQDASAVALEKETLAQKVEKLEKEIEEQKQFIESVSSVTSSIVPPNPDDIASINSLNESNKLKIEQLEIELGQAETGNDTLRARVEELEKTSAELRRKLKEATGISSVPPPPKLPQRRPSVKPPVRAGSPARSSSKPPVPNGGTGLPKPSAASSSTPPMPPTAVKIPLPLVPRSARQSMAQEPSVVVSLDYIGDIKKAENRKVGRMIRGFFDKLFTEVD